jgi:hypothetical protein
MKSKARVATFLLLAVAILTFSLIARAGTTAVASNEATARGLDPRVYIPGVAAFYCQDYFEAFNNADSGWPVGEDAFVRVEYLNEEYRIFTKDDRFLYLFRGPTCAHDNYMVEVDARWVGMPGGSYGLVFDITEGFNQYYVFDINTDFEDYRFFRRNADGTFTVIQGITSAPAINSGNTSNHLKVTRNGNQITLFVNGTQLGNWTDAAVSGLGGAGIMSSPYQNYPNSDARFDNFNVVRMEPSQAVPTDLAPAENRNAASDNVGRHLESIQAELKWE